MANAQGTIKARKVLRITAPNLLKPTQEITAASPVAMVAAASVPEDSGSLSPVATAAEVKPIRNDDAATGSAIKALQTAAFNLRAITEGLKALRPSVPSQTGSLLLDRLPQELRDIIWSYALVEPALCDKRHQPTCPFYDPSAPTETPPIELLRGQVVRAEHIWEDDMYFYDEKNARCKELCIRRKGLAIMRVNKQIYEETSPMFWKENMICLFNRHDASALLEGQRVGQDLSKVQKLMLWDFFDAHTWVRSSGQKDVWTLIHSMSSLRRLELSDDIAYYSINDFAGLPKLAEVRLWQFQQVNVASSGARLYIGTSRDFSFPTRPCGAVHGRKYETRRCIHCKDAGWSIDHLALEWTSNSRMARLERRFMNWVAATVTALGQELTPQHEGGAHLLDVCVPQTSSVEKVSVWGLPVCSAEERASIAKAREEATSERLWDKWVAQEKKKAAKRCENWEMIVEREREMAARLFAEQRLEKQRMKDKERAEKKKARGDFKARIVPPPPRGEPEFLDDDEVEVVATKADRRQPCRKSKKSDHEQVLGDRARHRQNVAFKEAARTRQAHKVEAAERRKQEEAVAASRKNASRKVECTTPTDPPSPQETNEPHSSARTKRQTAALNVSDIASAKKSSLQHRNLYDAFTVNEAAWTKAKAAERAANERLYSTPWKHPQRAWRDDEWRKCYRRAGELRHWLYVKQFELNPEWERSRWVERELKLLK